MGGAYSSLPIDNGTVRKAMNSIVNKLQHCLPLEMEQRQLVCAFIS